MLQEWNFYYGGYNDTLACHDIRFQVWRPDSGEIYQLVGENVYNFETVSGCGSGEGEYVILCKRNKCHDIEIPNTCIHIFISSILHVNTANHFFSTQSPWEKDTTLRCHRH